MPLVDSDPDGTAIARQRSSGQSSRYPTRNPASNVSPAPVVSTTSAGVASLRTTSSPLTASPPPRPHFTAPSAPGSARAAAAMSTSSMPVMARASYEFGKKQSVRSSSSGRPPSHPPDGPQFGPTEDVAPASGAS